MTAKEMWEELGYEYEHKKVFSNEKLESDEICIEYDDVKITIDNINKEITFWQERFDGMTRIFDITWNEDELKAFLKTLKELGWLND